ncbi:MAG: phosphatidylcholine/phosphatidylserine synthase [Gordonia sp. (in: high G+C Gram-positive bacteria)]|uniref:CDP-alcohol phosphatidyltransferase family protein n=1 Tax=Gordonia sp. (in: high G+C Gram-positive bacteria) TaxID=84139 RepID=UPI0039E3EA27
MSPGVTRRRRPVRRPRIAGRGRNRPVSTDAPTRSGRVFVPSAMTILALCASLTAVRSGYQGHIDLALILLVTAAVLDGLDGRIARLMGATSKIGAELDSLADAVNFGVAPALLTYGILLRESTGTGQDFGWLMVLVYCSAIILRLARFNTLLDDDTKPGYTRDFFVGVPAPAAAVMALLPIGLRQQFGDGWWTNPWAIGGWLLFVALLAVSRVPTLSFKSAKLRPRHLAGGLIVVAVAAALLFTFPYWLMIILVAGYLIHIPVAWYLQRWVSSRPEHWDSAPRDRRQQRRDDRRAEVAVGARRRVIPIRKSSARLGLRRPS